jgi:hypothetical protein
MWSCGLPRLPHRVGFAGDGAASCLAAPILSAVPIDRLPGCPGYGPSVSPMIRRRIAPRPESSGSGWCVFRVASERAFRFCQWLDRRVSPVRFPLVSPSVELVGCPASSVPLAAPTGQFPSCPESRAFGACLRASSPGCPGPLALWLAASASASCPALASTVGSMMNPLLAANFASSACAADESSLPIRSSSFLAVPRCSPNLFWPSAFDLRRR